LGYSELWCNRPAADPRREIADGDAGRSRGPYRSEEPRVDRSLSDSATPITEPLGDAGPHACHQLEPFQDPRREHRPDDHGRRRQVVPRDVLGESEAEGWQEWAVGSDTFQDRVRVDPGRCDSFSQHHPERLAPAVFDQHGLTRLERLERRRDPVAEGPPAGDARCIDGHLDMPGTLDALPIHRLASRRRAYSATRRSG